MDKAHTNNQMVHFIEVYGRMTSEMVMEWNTGQMVLLLKAASFKDIKKVTVNINGQTGLYLKDTGAITK